MFKVSIFSIFANFNFFFSIKGMIFIANDLGRLAIYLVRDNFRTVTKLESKFAHFRD